MIYDRKVLAEVVVYHHKVRIEGCLCGWSELGKSIGDHVADVYEAAIENKNRGTITKHDGFTIINTPEFQCQRTVGVHVYTVKDGITFDPPLRVPATCRMAYGHDGDCYP